MVDLRTVRAKECCCGCTLRTGSLILFWINLIISSVFTLYHFGDMVYGNKSRYATRYGFSVTQVTISAVYYFIWSTVAMIASLLGIYGIQKNIPKHLTFSLYYLGYFVFFFLVSIIVVIFFPKTYAGYIVGTANILYSVSREFLLVAIIAYLFVIVLTLYFMLIIRSCRDSMMKNSASGQANEFADPRAFGYNVSP